MCRDFDPRPVRAEVVDRLLDLARRAPSAGNTQGVAFVLLEGPDQTAAFWRLCADPQWLARPDHPGLLRAPVVVLPLHSEAAYRARYAEADKAAAGLAEAPWPVPFWVVDCAFATMSLLLGAADEGLGALFFGLRGDRGALLAALGVPAGWDAIGAIALGWPAAGERPSGSAATRPRKPLQEVVHRGGW